MRVGPLSTPESVRGLDPGMILDHRQMPSPDRPIIRLHGGAGAPGSGRRRTRGRSAETIPSELWGIDNNLNIANMDWQEFADHAHENGVFRGFDQ